MEQSGHDLIRAHTDASARSPPRLIEAGHVGFKSRGRVLGGGRLTNAFNRSQRAIECGEPDSGAGVGRRRTRRGVADVARSKWTISANGRDQLWTRASCRGRDKNKVRSDGPAIRAADALRRKGERSCWPRGPPVDKLPIVPADRNGCTRRWARSIGRKACRYIGARSRSAAALDIEGPVAIVK